MATPNEPGMPFASKLISLTLDKSLDGYFPFKNGVFTMAARPTWKGYLKLSLVSVPVKAYTVTDNSKSDITLNQLHSVMSPTYSVQEDLPRAR